MSQTKLEPATRQIHVQPDTYRTLRHIAVDRDLRLMDVAEEVIKAGLEVIRSREPATN